MRTSLLASGLLVLASVGWSPPSPAGDLEFSDPANVASPPAGARRYLGRFRLIFTSVQRSY